MTANIKQWPATTAKGLPKRQKAVTQLYTCCFQFHANLPRTGSDVHGTAMFWRHAVVHLDRRHRPGLLRLASVETTRRICEVRSSSNLRRTAPEPWVNNRGVVGFLSPSISKPSECRQHRVFIDQTLPAIDVTKPEPNKRTLRP